MKHIRDFGGGAALAGFDPRNLRSVVTPKRNYVRDEFQTFDKATVDSAGAFLIGELTRLDPMIHEPLVAVTWYRDIDLRTDVLIGDENSAFSISTFASTGGASSTGINWAGKTSTALSRVTLDIGKVTNPLTLWASEVAYSIPELRSAEQLGRPIDSQMLTGLNLKHQMDSDQIVYIGDSAIGTTGLANAALVTNNSTAAQAGASSPTGNTTSTKWVDKTPQSILNDFNALLESVWAASGYAVAPTKVLLSPYCFSYIATQPMTIGMNSTNPGTAGGYETILSFIKKNNLLTAQKDLPLDIQPVKWLASSLLGQSTDRMVAYCQRQDFVRFPMVPLQPLQPQPEGIWIKVPYYGRLGVVEVVYPETVGYLNGVN